MRPVVVACCVLSLVATGCSKLRGYFPGGTAKTAADAGAGSTPRVAASESAPQAPVAAPQAPVAVPQPPVAMPQPPAPPAPPSQEAPPAPTLNPDGKRLMGEANELMREYGLSDEPPARRQRASAEASAKASRDQVSARARAGDTEAQAEVHSTGVEIR